MRLPNKVISYNESIISKFPIILNLLKSKDYKVMELYEKLKADLDIECFIETLDCLFALGKIEIDYKARRIHYVVWNMVW